MSLNILDFINNVSVKTYLLGETVFKEKDPSNGMMYFVFTGAVEVRKSYDGETRVIRQMEPGSFFGEIALINNVPRAATVQVVSEKSKIGILDQEMFYRIGQTNPKFFSALLNTSIQRLASVEDEIARLQAGQPIQPLRNSRE
ncbi:cyclic nucleotide-binding domain-containing protein [Leptospira wolffii]|uniref:cAMP-binding protein n=1 Tax=Leptospira wolffii TaxID=409998 RepID=A0A2M9ZE34_9LEPT|nr:cyclic nucleotide-binding domain-containing protein [Leptospira wolffii]PJZ66634.1 cAMP-binding protein [Leptospira wolffii]TGK61608.1 cyclic nucleotide-binding domain-containing protein [Leptospira wolffii]TGK70152.1 cyclic nucleotide-binding domain-containing protein [Leptospira wolffii]TGK77075.1 cyclic nucleotide-binding domain-containing protein [Leptospira wolffii]TGL31073.1 cyclic nucleotide-binding domain-containing protein [Leptospira wolffii]